MNTKRLFDFIFALLGLLGLSSLLVLVYIIASWDTRSNGLFFQLRIGQYGRPFTIFKFKTLHQQTRHISCIGRFLRNSKLDELPQLWNVLIGDMSLIGSRPLLPEYLPLYSEVQKRRHEVRPGITGWAQVNGRNAISWK